MHLGTSGVHCMGGAGYQYEVTPPNASMAAYVFMMLRLLVLPCVIRSVSHATAHCAREVRHSARREIAWTGRHGRDSILLILYLLNRCVLPMRSEHPPTLWGGCLMYRASDLRANMYGILDRWRLGGFSDEMITMGLCKQFVRITGDRPRVAVVTILAC